MPRRPVGPTRSGGRRRLPAARAQRDVLDVTVVLIPEGYASEAIAPAEIFHSAGALWQSLRGEAPQPRFRVRIASVDGAPVTSLCDLRLVPSLAIQDVEHTDIIVLSASGLNVQEQIARGTTLLPWLREWHARGAYIAAVCTGAAFLAESGLLDGRQATTTGPSRTRCAGSTRTFCGGRSSSSRRTTGCSAAAAFTPPSI